MEAPIHAGILNALFAAILAVIMAGLAVLFRRRPAVVHALWILVLVKFLVPSVYPVEIPWWRPSPAQLDGPETVVVQENVDPRTILVDQLSEPREDVSPESAVSEPQPVGVLQPTGENLEPAVTGPTIPPNPNAGPVQLSWERIVGMVWLTGSLTWLVIAAIRIVRFQRILRFAKPAHPELQIRVQMLAERLGLSACPSVSLVSAPIAPLLWALTRSPQLLIPEKLWERLNKEQRDTLLVHELAHLRRGDHWVRRLEMLVLALYWWHPVVWYAQRRLREAEEQCCDSWVLWVLPHAAQDYAVALVETLAFLSHSRPALPLGASGIEPMRLLKRRLSMIVQGQPPRGVSRLACWAIVGVGLLLLPLLPIPAQQTSNPESDDEEQVQPPPSPGSAPASTETPTLQPAPTQVAPPIRADRAEQIEAARDEVELVKAKLMIRRAELEETKTKLRLAQRNLSRLEEAFKKGTVPESMMESTRTEAELLQPQLNTKQAQIQEAEILLKQAERRLRRLEASPKTEEAPLIPPPMKGSGGPPPAKSGSSRISGPGGLGKGLPAQPGSGTPSKMAPGLPGPGRPIKGAPRLPVPGADGALPGTSSGRGGPGVGAPRKRVFLEVEGTVLEVDPKTRLATISVGSESGIRRGNLLDVYRVLPNPKYLGKMEILEAKPDKSVGRINDMRINDMQRAGPIEKGDHVAGRVTGGPDNAEVGTKLHLAWADQAFEETSWDFGSVRRGEQLGHSFRLANIRDEPIHIAAVRSSAAYLTPNLVVKVEGGAQARETEVWLGQYQDATIEVSVDTRRFVGDKTATVYVQFDQPAVAEVQLQVRARSVESRTGTTLPGSGSLKGEPQESKARILELEIKVDQLMKQLDALRHELKSPVDAKGLKPPKLDDPAKP
jgi:beta-lactamase regulating signal transducer with metallopeptidase domain